MCDTELIAAILEELGYLDQNKKEDKKEEVRDKESYKCNFKKIVWKKENNNKLNKIIK